jgi:hypothetical protein
MKPGNLELGTWNLETLKPWTIIMAYLEAVANQLGLTIRELNDRITWESTTPGNNEIFQAFLYGISVRPAHRCELPLPEVIRPAAVIGMIIRLTNTLTHGSGEGEMIIIPLLRRAIRLYRNEICEYYSSDAYTALARYPSTPRYYHPIDGLFGQLQHVDPSSLMDIYDCCGSSTCWQGWDTGRVLSISAGH